LLKDVALKRRLSKVFGETPQRSLVVVKAQYSPFSSFFQFLERVVGRVLAFLKTLSAKRALVVIRQLTIPLRWATHDDGMITRFLKQLVLSLVSVITLV